MLYVISAFCVACLFEVVLMVRGVSKLSMFGFLCKGVCKPKESLFSGYSTKNVSFFEDPFLIRCISTISSGNNHSFTVSYLMDSCGISENKAIAMSKQLQFDNPSKPDSVLALLKSYEIPKFVTSKFITKNPLVLVANADKFIKPKLEYLKSLGLSVPAIVRLLTYNPYFFNSSLENRIIPHISFLKNIVTTNSNVVALLCRSSWSVIPDTEKVLAVNIELLRDSGVPDSNIGKIILLQPHAFMRTVVSFKEIVEEIKKMEFDPLKYTFAAGISVLAKLSKSSWEAKISMYKKWGLSEEVIYKAFRSQPNFMAVSLKKGSDILEFLVNTIGCDPLIVAKNPFIMTLSLDKRIIPRGLVLKLLISKKLMREDYNISASLGYSEKDFVEKFVTKFQDAVPEILDAFHGKMKDF